VELAHPHHADGFAEADNELSASESLFAEASRWKPVGWS